jgi:hypothetical protein
VGRDSPIGQQPPASWRPSRFAPPVAARSSDGFDQELAERVAEDAERCLREHLLIPTIRRYSPAVEPGEPFEIEGLAVGLIRNTILM